MKKIIDFVKGMVAELEITESAGKKIINYIKSEGTPKCATHPPAYIIDWEQGYKMCQICKEKWLPE